MSEEVKRPCPHCGNSTIPVANAKAQFDDGRIVHLPDGCCLLDCMHCGTRLHLGPTRQGVRLGRPEDEPPPPVAAPAPAAGEAPAGE